MGYSFQDDSVQMMDTDVGRLLAGFVQGVDDFAADEDFAKHLVAIFASNDNEAIRAIDIRKLSTFSSELWQTRNWYFRLAKVVPNLLLQLMKLGPKNLKELEKAHKFWSKPFKFSPKSMSPSEEVAKKYLAVLKDLRKQLEACQEAAQGGSGMEPIKVGKFELYNGVGVDADQLKKAQDVLKDASKAMHNIGLGEYCYGPVTLVNSSKLHDQSAAFYVKNTDEIYLSPDVRAGEDVRALCHEVAHRVHTKRHLKAKAEELYRIVGQNGSWVTSYAKTNPEENFCEMVSFAAMRQLKDPNQEPLKAVVPDIKTASAQSVLMRYTATRVADRFADQEPPSELRKLGVAQLAGMYSGTPVTLYHGSTRLFRKFDMNRSRDELVDRYYGKGIFLTPSKMVASAYADANRNIGFDPSVIDDLGRKNPNASKFLRAIYEHGVDGWEKAWRDNGFWRDDPPPGEGHVDMEGFQKFLGGVDPNTLGDIAGYIHGSATKPLGSDSDVVNIFSMSSGAPSYLYDYLDEVGLNSKVYRPKIYTVTVRVSNPLLTKSKAKARRAKQDGYDSVIFYGADLVKGVPEVAVFDPRNVRIKSIEVV